MKIHHLKILEKYHKAVEELNKTFEIRKDDKNFQVGDLIIFENVYEDGEHIITPELFEITYIYRYDGEHYFGVEEGYCVMSIEKVEHCYIYNEKNNNKREPIELDKEMFYNE